MIKIFGNVMPYSLLSKFWLFGESEVMNGLILNLIHYEVIFFLNSPRTNPSTDVREFCFDERCSVSKIP
jgi:hypothetical protein